jgi:radical SAM superfamily enzyme with C-terminal helix-hairpin-helix motif
MTLARNKIIAFAGTTLLALALAACGGSSSGTGSTATSSQSVATAAPAPATTAAPTTTAAESSATTAAESATSAPAATASQPEATSAPAATDAAATISKLNLNDVTEDQLLSTIPGFSNRMVREFFEYRPYISILQFRKEIGKYVDEAQVAAYEQYVYVPIDVDQADAATLQQLPEVDATIVDQLIAGRPYGSNDAFLAKLGGLAPGADLQQAAAYLVN